MSLLALTSCGPAAGAANTKGAQAVAQRGPPATLDDVRARVEEIMARNGVAGVGLALASRDQVLWIGGIGSADVASAQPVTRDTVFRLGSVSKNVVALAMLEQVERGRLSLDDRLHNLAPEVEFNNPWEDTSPVTIAQLLEHTAGFEFGRFNEDWEEQPLPLFDALAVNPRSRVSRWPPGTRMSYSNEGYVAAGYVLEKVTGDPFAAVIQTGIFEPLDMKTSAFQLTPATIVPLAQGYDSGGKPVPYLEDMQRPAAGLLSSPVDMARYLQFWLRDGDLEGTRLVSTAGIKRMQERRTLPYDGPDEQYGLGTDSAQYAGHLARGHTGYTDGFVASFRYFPKDGVGWVLMINQSNADTVRAEIEDVLAGYLFGGHSSPQPTEFPVSAAALAALTGYYRDVTPGQEILAPLTRLFGGTQVQLNAGELQERRSGFNGLRSLVAFGPWRRLVPTSGIAFRHEDESASSVLFTRDENGRQILVTADGYLQQDSLIIAMLERGLMLAGLALVSSTLILAPVWLGWRLLGGGDWLGPSLAWVPAVLVALVCVALLVVLRQSSESLGQLNFTSVSLFVFTITFALFSLLAVVGSVRMLASDAELVAKGYVFLLGCACFGLTVFAWQAQWIGLRTWLW